MFWFTIWIQERFKQSLSLRDRAIFSICIWSEPQGQGALIALRSPSAFPVLYTLLPIQSSGCEYCKSCIAALLFALLQQTVICVCHRGFKKEKNSEIKKTKTKTQKSHSVNFWENLNQTYMKTCRVSRWWLLWLLVMVMAFLHNTHATCPGSAHFNHVYSLIAATQNSV